MEQLKKLYNSLSHKQRWTIVSALAFTLLVLGLVQWYSYSNFKPLYTSLSPEDAGAVIERLKESGVEYRLGDNDGTILVPAGDVAESRLQMALAGLPKTGRIGFELFDRTNLGVTEFAEHINYQRALEGELERSVMSLAEVEQARVHITLAKDSVFAQSREPAKASVLVKLRPGSPMAPRSVMAISHLVASAVEGLAPQFVSVLDMNGYVLSRSRGSLSLDLAQSSDALVEYQQSIEKSLLDKISATLEPLLGPGKFRAGVSVECDFSTQEQSEESFDPSQSVVVNSQLTQETTGANGSSGIPGTASALPRPRSEITANRSGVARITENTAYQSSRTVRRIKTPQGSVKRVSAAVLVDYAVRWEGEGETRKRTLEERSPEKMQAIRDLVAAAIGLDTERGDQLIVQTLPFEMTLQLEQQDLELAAPTPGPSGKLRLLEQLMQDPRLLAATVIGVCLLLLLAAWSVSRSRRRKRQVSVGTSPQALPAPRGRGFSQTESLQEGADTPSVPDHAVGGSTSSGVLPPPSAGSMQQTLIREVQEIVKGDSEISAGIIHGWLIEERRH